MYYFTPPIIFQVMAAGWGDVLAWCDKALHCVIIHDTQDDSWPLRNRVIKLHRSVESIFRFLKMNCSIASRFSATLGGCATRTTYLRITLVRSYAAKKGKGQYQSPYNFSGCHVYRIKWTCQNEFLPLQSSRKCKSLQEARKMKMFLCTA